MDLIYFHELPTKVDHYFEFFLKLYNEENVQ